MKKGYVKPEIKVLVLRDVNAKFFTASGGPSNIPVRPSGGVGVVRDPNQNEQYIVRDFSGDNGWFN